MIPSIIEDFAAIKARLSEIEKENGTAVPVPETKPEEPAIINWMGVGVPTVDVDDMFCC